MLVKEAVEGFIAWCLEQRLKPATIAVYRGRLVWLKRALGERELDSLTKEDVKAFLARESRFADGRPKAPDTIRLNAVAFDRVQKWALEHGHLDDLIIAKIPKPGGRKRELLPAPEETQQILNEGPEDFQMIYRALRLCGARPGELCAAQIKDIDRRAGEIVLKDHKTVGKTGRPRRIALGHPALAELVRQAISDRTEGPIFLRANGRAWDTQALSSAYRRARKRAGLPEGLVLYLARHEHATQLYKKTGDLKAVADALGHTQIQTTMRYTRVDGETLKKNQQLFDEGLPGDARAA